jgi:hypothetical protein
LTQVLNFGLKLCNLLAGVQLSGGVHALHTKLLGTIPSTPSPPSQKNNSKTLQFILKTDLSAFPFVCVFGPIYKKTLTYLQSQRSMPLFSLSNL